MTKDGQVISRKMLEACLDDENANTYLIILDKKKPGGVILKIVKKKKIREFEILFVGSDCQRKGIGTSTWMTIEKMLPEIELWITHTPYFEKRNIQFYINNLGFHGAKFTHERNRSKQSENEFRDPSRGIFQIPKIKIGIIAFIEMIIIIS